jgi:hypothetical protein
MKNVLKQDTPAGPLYIAKSEGRYHVVWAGESLGTAPSLQAAIRLARAGPLAAPPDGTDFGALGISDEPQRWIVTKS